MQKTKKPLANGASKYAFHQFISVVVWPQTIAMAYIDFLAVPLKSFGVKINMDVQFFLKIASHPHIVVAHKKMNRNTAISQFGQFAQQPDIALGNYMPVLKPEVEHVAYNKYFGSRFFNSI